VLQALDRIAEAHPNGDDVLVVAHGGVISVYACHLLGCSFNTLWRLRVDNCALTTVEPPRIVTLNDATHLVAAGVARNWPSDAVGGNPPPRDGPSA
jgi:broad specificity phosphatase PhoE